MDNADRVLATQDTLAERIATLAGVLCPFLGLVAAIVCLWGWAFTWLELALLLVMYMATGLGITMGFHRLFAHRSFDTVRPIRFLLAVLGSMSVQGPVLRWVAIHRSHHNHSDTPEDPHSMKLYGFWYSHVGWILGPDYKKTEFKAIKDFAKFPELVWLNRFYIIPPIVLGTSVFLLGGYVNGGSMATLLTHGWSTLVVGFGLSTVILWHGTFSINSIMHKFGKPRYDTGDESKNSLWLALLTLGEGWHNNHHYYPGAVRQGFYWWEIDLTYYALWLMARCRIIWDLNRVPVKIRDSHHIS